MTLLPLWFASLAILANPAIAPPRVLDDRLEITLFAAEPDVVTPAGIAVDHKGRVLVVESHTHFRPANYQGPPADRIRLLEDADGDGRAETVTTFYEGMQYTMNVGVHPDGSVYVATRSEIFRLRDTDDDGKADERTPIARLETKGNYPHNGLSGFAFDFQGNVTFGLGENLGAEFKLIGTDGSVVSDLEGGQIYRCTAGGEKIERVAFGFWNPFHVAFDAFGRLFAVDNDPDSMPPCRLMHIVEGGNYGYRYRNGRRGVHPFTAWNGELPGTLPMVSGTGEAPSGVVAYESDHLPDDYRGELLVTSWGDHRLERHRLEPRGASFRSVPTFFVQGDENFRPVGIATAPDGSLFVSDWVLRDYDLHGKGRVWHITRKDVKPRSRSAESLGAADRIARENAWRALSVVAGGSLLRKKDWDMPSFSDPRLRMTGLEALSWAGNLEPVKQAAASDPSPNVRAAAIRLLGEKVDAKPLLAANPPPEIRAELLRHSAGPELRDELWRSVADSDAFIAQAARHGLARLGLKPAEIDWDKLDAPQRLAAQLILREYRIPVGTAALPRLLCDPDTAVRFAAIQWVGEDRLTEFRQPLVEALSAGPATSRLFGGYLAALERLDGVSRTPSDEWAGEQYIIRALDDAKTPPEARRWSLRMLRPDHPALSLERLRGFLASNDEALRLEAVRTLRDSPLEQRESLLREIADSQKSDIRLRAEAIVGLSSADPASRTLLLKLAAEGDLALRAEALRSLRGAELTDADRASLRQAAASSPALGELADRLTQPSPSASAESQAAERDVDTWLSLLHEAPGDPAAGERIFFHRQSAACARCHQIGGRGARVGPELTATTGTLSERRLVESIVHPAREIAPQFVAWAVATTDGRSLNGVVVHEEATGEQTYADQDGKLTVLKPSEIETRKPLATSIMPEGLPRQMTVQEFRDLLAFLRAGGEGNPAN